MTLMQQIAAQENRRAKRRYSISEGVAKALLATDTAAQIKRVVREAAWQSGVPYENIVAHCRTPEYVRVRRVSMWCAKNQGHTNADISRFFDCDHSTVSAALKWVEERLGDDGSYVTPAIAMPRLVDAKAMGVRACR